MTALILIFLLCNCKKTASINPASYNYYLTFISEVLNGMHIMTVIGFSSKLLLYFMYFSRFLISGFCLQFHHLYIFFSSMQLPLYLLIFVVVLFTSFNYWYHNLYRYYLCRLVSTQLSMRRVCRENLLMTPSNSYVMHKPLLVRAF
jgi:predicted membrane protein